MPKYTLTTEGGHHLKRSGAFLSKAGARGRFLEGGFHEEGGAHIKGGSFSITLEDEQISE